TSQGQDVFISYPRPGDKRKSNFNTFDIGRNFANKLWNATRLILSNTGEKIGPAEPVDSELADQWILSRYNRTILQFTESLESFRFNDAAHLIYDFIWHDFCDWYLEIIKPRISTGGNERTYVMRNAANILAGSMQLLHPLMPFLTEEIWQRLTEVLDSKPSEVESIMVSSWPQADTSLVDEAIEYQMEIMKSLIVTIRTIRNEMNVPTGRKVDVVIIPADDDTNQIFSDNRAYIIDLGSVNNLKLNKNTVRPPKSAAGISEKSEVFVLLEGLVDIDRERIRLGKEIERRKNFIKNTETKLQNRGFLSKAPKNVIQQERLKLGSSREELKKLISNLEALED
ncbi:MAG TPA: class I tRNA ligase family protein, partial [Anaerolineae bacterium]|nr:class I tRNA ligase family protein [Anaerolineae bacterium]